MKSNILYGKYKESLKQCGQCLVYSNIPADQTRKIISENIVQFDILGFRRRSGALA